MIPVKLPPQYQKGGKFKVSGYIALALLALAVAEGVYIRYLSTHRTFNIIMVMPTADGQTALPPTEISKDADAYVTHAFPPERNVCTFVDTICYISI